MGNVPGFTAEAALRPFASASTITSGTRIVDGMVTPAARCCDTCDFVCSRYGDSSTQCGACHGSCIDCSGRSGDLGDDGERTLICKTDKYGHRDCWWIP